MVAQLQAETAVLGSMLIEPKCVGSVVSMLFDDDFENPIAKSLYRHIKKIFLDGGAIDPVVVLETFKSEMSDVTEIRKYIIDVMELTPTASNVSEYIQILKHTSKLNRLKRLGGSLSNATSFNEINELISQLNSNLIDTQVRSRLAACDIVSDFMDRHSQPEPKYLPWCFKRLAEKTYAELGDFVIVGGYPSAGKTAIGLQFAWSQSQQYRVGFYSLETRTEKMADRSMAHLIGLDLSNIKQRKLVDRDWQAVADNSNDISRRQFEMISAGGMSVNDIMADAIANNYQIIYLDYVQLINGDGRNRFEIVSSVSIALHQFSQRHNITVIALSQLRRPESSKGKKDIAPTMSSLRESGQLEQDADLIMLLYRERPDDPVSRRILTVAKNKEGTLGKIFLDFNGPKQTFTESFQNTKNAINEAIKEAVDERKQITFSELPSNTPLPF